MADDGGLASVLSGNDALAPEVLQAIHNEQARNYVQDPNNWQGGGLYGGLARIMAGALEPNNGPLVSDITQQRIAAQPDEAKLLASPDPYAAVAADPSQYSPLARTMVLNGATPATVADSRLKSAQAAFANAQGQLATRAATPMPPLYDNGSGPGTSTTPQATPSSGPVDPNVFGTVLNTARARNISPVAMTALVGAGLGEGGFGNPWAPSGVPDRSSPTGTEESYGPWQLHKGGELDGYLAAGGKPGDVAAQTNFVLNRLEQIHPGFSQITDPGLAAQVVHQFENGKGGADYYAAQFPSAQSLILSQAQKPTQMAQASTGTATDATQPQPGAAAAPPQGTTPSGYTPQQMAALRDAGMIGSNGLPVVPPSVQFNSQGVPYNPAEIGANGVTPPAHPFGAPSAPAPSAPPQTPPAAAPGPASSANPQPPLNAPRINPAAIAWAQEQTRLNAALGRQSPQWISDLTTMAPGLPNSPEYKAAVAGAEKQAGAPYDIHVSRDGTVINGFGQVLSRSAVQVESVDPQTGQQKMVWVFPPLPTQEGGAGAAGAAPGQTPAAAPNQPSLNASGGNPSGTEAPGGPAITTKLGPGQTEALETRAKEEQEQRQKVINDGNMAQQSQATLQNMANEVGNFKQGPFADHVQKAATYLRLIDPNWDGQVAGFEDFVKNAGSLTRTAVHDTSSRASQQEFSMINNTLPNPDMSPMGLQRVQNELLGLSDFKIAKAQAQQAWEQQHGGIGNVSGFETDFQNKVSPYAFIVGRMAQPDRQQMFAKLQGSAEGRQELTQLGQQLGNIKQMGLSP